MDTKNILQSVKNFFKYFLGPEIHAGTDWRGDYVEVNGERHYHQGSAVINFKNGWRAKIKVSQG